MYDLVARHGVPTPFTLFPERLEDVEASLHRVKFPLMLKGIYGNRLQARGKKKMVVVHSEKELLAQYKEMEEPGFPGSRQMLPVMRARFMTPGLGLGVRDDCTAFRVRGYFGCCIPG